MRGVAVAVAVAVARQLLVAIATGGVVNEYLSWHIPRYGVQSVQTYAPSAGH